MNKVIFKFVKLWFCILCQLLVIELINESNLSFSIDNNTTKSMHSISFFNNEIAWTWWEAEEPIITNFPSPENNPFAPYNPDESKVLSENSWIGISGDYEGKTMFLEYLVNVPKDAEYHFYVRKFWKHGPFRWRFDDQDYSIVGRNVSLLDEEHLRKFVVANWIYAGNVQLSKGQHKLRIELIEGQGASAFDCFLLTTQFWLPEGKLKPNEKREIQISRDWFAFEPDTDPFNDSPIDLRNLNEKIAGEKGFICVKDKELIHENTGELIRFWGVNAGPDIVQLPKPYVDYLARYLAKLGINIVRIHGRVWRDEDFRQVDNDYLDSLFYFTNAMQKEGIYTGISFYFPLWLTLSKEHGFAGYKNKHPFALLFFNHEFQETYRGWLKALLNTVNPYTGLSLKETPSVAFLELVNEDSYLFWTFNYNNVPDAQMAILEHEFAEWLENRYGSLDSAYKKWNGRKHDRDDLAEKRIGFLGLWEIFNQRDKRCQDTAEFLTTHQKSFFEKIITYVKEELGFKGLIVCSNWITASEHILGPLDKWSNTVGDIMDRHGYFSGQHKGETSGWSISQGDLYEDRCALLEPNEPSFSLPIMDIKYNNKPSIISEVNWTPPNRFRLDFPVLCSVYGALQGSDGFFFFALSGAYWQRSLTKFAIQTPNILGQSPALSLIYRKGLIKEGNVIAKIELKLADLFALNGAPFRAPINLDELRKKDVPENGKYKVEKLDALDPQMFFIGQVLANITEQGGSSEIADLSMYVDHENKTIKSSTGELLWNYEKGLVLIDAPYVQGVTGFLSKERIFKLTDITIETDIDYGTVIVVSLDNQPIRDSHKMLVQVMTEENNNGWSAPGEGLRKIQSLGENPIILSKISGKISILRYDADLCKVTALDFMGYPIESIGNASNFRLKENVLYYIIEKRDE